MRLGIDPDLIEQFQIAKGSVQFALEYRLKVDGLLGAVLKPDTNRVRRHDFKRLHLMNCMLYRLAYFNSALIAKDRRISLARTLQNTLGLCSVSSTGTLLKVIRGSKRRKLLRHCNINELIQRHSFRAGHTLGFLKERRLKPKRNVTSSHFSFLSTQ